MSDPLTFQRVLVSAVIDLLAKHPAGVALASHGFQVVALSERCSLRDVGFRRIDDNRVVTTVSYPPPLQVTDPVVVRIVDDVGPTMRVFASVEKMLEEF